MSFHVYVLQLRSRFSPPDVYVGSTALSVKERVAHHLDVRGLRSDKRASSNVVRHRFDRVRRDLAPRRSYRTREEAKRAERRTALDLELRGYKVYGACAPRRNGCRL